MFRSPVISAPCTTILIATCLRTCTCIANDVLDKDAASGRVRGILTEAGKEGDGRYADVVEVGNVAGDVISLLGWRLERVLTFRRGQSWTLLGGFEGSWRGSYY